MRDNAVLRNLAGRKQKRPVSRLIAAGTEHLGGEVLTQNVRHFPMFADLRPAY